MSGMGWVICLFIACNYTSMEAAVFSSPYSCIWSSMPKVNKSLISLERVEWFCWFFACNYLYLVRYLLKLQKYAILGWLCQG